MKLHRTTSLGRASEWKSTLCLEDILLRHLQGKTSLANHAPPMAGLPEAQDFIEAIKEFTPDVELTADGACPYGLYTAYYWRAFNCMYAFVPEVNSAERYEGEWATIASVEEFVQEVQHSVWYDKFQADVEEYIEQHPEHPFK
jgi:hypothetical protein